MPPSTLLKNQHLLWRAGFGPAVEQLPDLQAYDPNQFFKALLKASSRKPEFIDVADDYLKGLVKGVEEVGRQQRKQLSEDERKQVQKKNREGIRSLNLNWLKVFVNTDAQLREKLAFFWHGHFACRNLNVFYQQGLLDVIRRNALGNFRDMLHEVSKSAAMLNFLNAQQNRKGHPNENFAREVMELFTLGRGNYSEQDIKEAARAFTGWSSNLQGQFVFRRNLHDSGTKTVLGKTGNLEGEDVLDILLNNPQTATYIVTKMYRFFVNEKVDREKVKWLAERFYKSNYDISKLAEDIFTSNWFYEEKNIGSLIKSPIELLAGIQRMLPMKLDNEEALSFLQRALGQVLFYPPNVAGWPGGKAWIDSSTLMLRMRLPQLINEADELNIRAKDDDDQMMGRMEKQDGMGAYGRRMTIKASIDWSKYVKFYQSTPREELVKAISSQLLLAPARVPQNVVSSSANSNSREEFIRSVTLQVMSVPEYQLC